MSGNVNWSRKLWVVWGIERDEKVESSPYVPTRLLVSFPSFPFFFIALLLPTHSRPRYLSFDISRAFEFEEEILRRRWSRNQLMGWLERRRRMKFQTTKHFKKFETFLESMWGAFGGIRRALWWGRREGSKSESNLLSPWQQWGRECSILCTRGIAACEDYIKRISEFMAEISFSCWFRYSFGAMSRAGFHDKNPCRRKSEIRDEVEPLLTGESWESFAVTNSRWFFFLLGRNINFSNLLQRISLFFSLSHTPAITFILSRMQKSVVVKFQKIIFYIIPTRSWILIRRWEYYTFPCLLE